MNRSNLRKVLDAAAHSMGALTFAALFLVAVTFAQCAEAGAGAGIPIEFKNEEARGRIQVLIGGKEALVYCYGKEVDLPHFYPVRSPSGKSMTVQQTEPYPHHRSFWFTDTVQLEGQRQVSFYNALYTGVGDRKNPKPPFRDRIRHAAFTAQRSGNKGAELGMKLIWETTEHFYLLLTNPVDVAFGLDGQSTSYFASGIGIWDDDPMPLTHLGSDGPDWLQGGAGVDIFRGYGGNDTLIGGAGSDTFVYSSINDGVDTITDFTPGAGGDKLDIHDVLVDYNAPERSSFVQLDDSSGVSTTVMVDADGPGSIYSPVALATLQNVTGLSLDNLLQNGNLVV